jgi:hypothetical protein
VSIGVKSQGPRSGNPRAGRQFRRSPTHRRTESRSGHWGNAINEQGQSVEKEPGTIVSPVFPLTHCYEPVLTPDGWNDSGAVVKSATTLRREYEWLGHRNIAERRRKKKGGLQ